MIKHSIIVFLVFVLNLNVSNAQNGWVQQNSGVLYHLLDVDFIDYNTGWAVGTAGKIIKTTNGGENWFGQNSQNTFPIFASYFYDSNTGWCVGTYSFYPMYTDMTILNTSDGGNTWHEQLSFNNYYRYLTSIHFINSQTGFAVGGSFGNIGGGILFSTSNGGLNWNYRDFTSSNTIKFNGVSTGFILSNFLGYSGYADTAFISKTVDTGKSWFKEFARPSTYFINGQYIDSSNAVVLGRDSSGSIILKTTSAGQNWSIIDNDLPEDNWLKGVFFINENTGWMTGYKIYKTTNGGTNWTVQMNLNDQSNSIIFIDSLYGFCVGNNGKIFKTITGGLTSIYTHSESSDKSSISQNYPNPYNSVTKIKFNISSDIRNQMSDVKLVVYDELGREVVTLVNEKLSSGSYEVEFDGSILSSGVYYYRLNAGNFTAIKKLVLLK